MLLLAGPQVQVARRQKRCRSRAAAGGLTDIEIILPQKITFSNFKLVYTPASHYELALHGYSSKAGEEQARRDSRPLSRSRWPKSLALENRHLDNNRLTELLSARQGPGAASGNVVPNGPKLVVDCYK